MACSLEGSQGSEISSISFWISSRVLKILADTCRFLTCACFSYLANLTTKLLVLNCSPLLVLTYLRSTITMSSFYFRSCTATLIQCRRISVLLSYGH